MHRWLSGRLASAFAVAVIALTASGAHAAEGGGRIVESREFKSTILGRSVRYSAYLPHGYEFDSTRRYPVVYLLHDYPTQSVNSETDWIQQGAADRLADKAIDSGRIPPVILVMPDAQTTWYMNSADDKVRYEDMLLQEFIPCIDRNFRTRTQPMFRSLVGISMGGYGALMLALRHADLFSSAAALSPILYTDEEMMTMPEAEYAERFAPLFGASLPGEARLNEAWRTHSPLSLARTLPLDQLKRTRLWIDIGDDDSFSQGSDALHTVLRQRQIPHEYRVRDGGHEWAYWRSGLVDALEFVARAYW